MKIILRIMIGFGILLSISAVVLNWYLYGIHAAVFTLSGIFAVIGIFSAFESLDQIEDYGSQDDD